MQTDISIEVGKAPKMKEHPDVELLHPDECGSEEDRYWIERWNYLMSDEAILENLKCNS